MIVLAPFGLHKGISSSVQARRVTKKSEEAKVHVAEICIHDGCMGLHDKMQLGMKI